MTDSADIAGLSAVAVARRLRTGNLTARQVVESSLARIAALDDDLHAFVTVAAETALADAGHLDAQAMAGNFAGPLHGIPVAVKDLIPTAGIRTTRGSRLHASDVPAEDDLVVSRLKAAGAVVIGKTNTPEFGFGALCRNPIAGNTLNPYSRDRTSGGSSGGSAVAVATGMAPLGLGTDFGGSVRTPASFCNILGFRPSAGRIPKVPKPLLWETMSTYGLMGREVADIELMLAAVMGRDHRDPASFDGTLENRAGEPRIAASLDLGIARIAGEVGAAFEEALARVRDGGFPIRPVTPDFSEAQFAFETLRSAAIFNEFGKLLDRDDLSPTVRWNAERGRNLTAADVYRAEGIRARIYQGCVKFFEAFDFLLLPSCSVGPWPADQAEVEAIDGEPTRNIIDYLTITYAISLVGLPALSIPAGWLGDGLPFGLQIVGGPRTDGAVLAFAARLERELGFHHSFPAIRPG